MTQNDALVARQDAELRALRPAGAAVSAPRLLAHPYRAPDELSPGRCVSPGCRIFRTERRALPGDVRCDWCRRVWDASKAESLGLALIFRGPEARDAERSRIEDAERAERDRYAGRPAGGRGR